MDFSKPLLGAIISVIILGIPVRLLYDFWLKERFGQWLAATSQDRAAKRLARTLLKSNRLAHYQKQPLNAIGDALYDIQRLLVAAFAMLFGCSIAVWAAAEKSSVFWSIFALVGYLLVVFGLVVSLRARDSQDFIDSVTEDSRTRALTRLRAEAAKLTQKYPALVDKFRGILEIPANPASSQE